MTVVVLRVTWAEGVAWVRRPLPCTLGRDPDSDLLLGDPLVSAVHAVLAEGAEFLSVTDHGSSNGTFVDGERLTVGEPRSAEAFQLGETTVQVAWWGAESTRVVQVRRLSGRERRDVVVRLPALLGRSAACGLRLDDPALQPEHALLLAADDGLEVRVLQPPSTTLLAEAHPWRIGDHVLEVALQWQPEAGGTDLASRSTW